MIMLEININHLLYTIPLSRYESDINYALTNKCH